MALLTQDFPGTIMRPNHAHGIPRRFLYLDVETEDVPAGLFTAKKMILAWTCDCRYKKDATRTKESWFKWYDGEKLWNYIDDLCYPKTVQHIVAHNAFFDLQASGFFKYMAKLGWQLKFFYEKNLTYILVAEKEEQVIKVISSTNFYECSLAELGQMVNIPKMEIDFDKASIEELSPYCKNDVRILRAGMEKYFRFIVVNRLGKFSLTKASQAMHAYRHRFMSHKIVTHSDARIIELELSSYFGGRCECFEIGEIKDGPFVTLDINSMYPFIMQREPVPRRLVDYLKNYNLELMPYVLRKFCAVARCRVNTDLPMYPRRHNSRVVFPVGSFDCVLTTPALKEALKRGHLEHIYEIALYEKAVLFEEYVRHFFHLRKLYKKAGRQVEEWLVKKFQVALYGKFSQMLPIIESDENCTDEDYDRQEVWDLVTHQMETMTTMLNRRITTFGAEPAPTSFVAIAAHITGAAQIYLWSLIEPLWPDRILYVDTDSLKLRESDIGLVDSVINHYKLGALKVEDRSNRLQIFAPKAYQTDRKRVIKGIPKRAEQIGPIRYRYDAFLKNVSHLRKQTSYGVLSHTVTKTLKKQYTKGIVLPTGRIIPFQL